MPYYSLLRKNTCIIEPMQNGLQKLIGWIFFLAIPLAAAAGMYYGILWASYNFDPNFLEIDKCVQQEGTWDEFNARCIPKGSR